MTATTADLERVGLGTGALDPISPPPSWARLHTSAHSVLKASRAVLLVEHVAVRLGLPQTEAERLRPLLYVMACAVYDWDAAAEDAPGEAEEELAQHRLRLVVTDIVGVGVELPADLDGLRHLADAERAALAGDLPAAEAFEAVSRWRSCDLRLMLWLVAVLHGWSTAVVDAVAPLLELFEVDDDLGSVPDDERRGSYNSWLVLRRELSADDTAAFLRRWAQGRAAVLVDALAALPSHEAARVEALLGYPLTAGRPLAIGLLHRSPRSARRLARRFVATRLGDFFHARCEALRAG